MLIKTCPVYAVFGHDYLNVDLEGTDKDSATYGCKNIMSRCNLGETTFCFYATLFTCRISYSNYIWFISFLGKYNID